MEISTALITGGSSGIGKSIVKAIAELGIATINADKQPPVESHPMVSFLECDVAKAEDVQNLYNIVKSNWNIPEIMVLNAGISVHERLDEGDPEKWHQVYNTNIMGALRMIRAFAPEMKLYKSARIIFISSVAAGKIYPYGGIYSSSKIALETIAETLRVELHPDIKVTIVSPGITTTEFFNNELAGNRSLDDFPLAGLNPQDVADQIINVIRGPENLVINKIIIRPEAQEF
ncbi:SDR family oxidoreductase [Negadavirga shengliensis]|uniref:SDR family oxidoreductase n=1 Tax=Negadavirga shengliensis TaxID=1389218 RepID=A0ABV9T7A8_9BACT